MPTNGKKKPAKKKTGGLRSNAGVTSQERASANRKLTRAMNPRRKKKAGETKAQKKTRKATNKQIRKSVRAAGKAGRKMGSDAKGKARKFLH